MPKQTPEDYHWRKCYRRQHRIVRLLLNASQAALSQLTEDRPEYLESDIKQLRQAIKSAEEELCQPHN